MAFNAHGFTGISAAAGYGAIENPGVAAQQRAFLAVFQSNYFHAAIVVAANQGRLPERLTNADAVRCAWGRCALLRILKRRDRRQRPGFRARSVRDRSRMGRIVNLGQVLEIEPGVDLRGRDVRVAQ